MPFLDPALGERLPELWSKSSGKVSIVVYCKYSEHIYGGYGHSMAGRDLAVRERGRLSLKMDEEA